MLETADTIKIIHSFNVSALGALSVSVIRIQWLLSNETFQSIGAKCFLFYANLLTVADAVWRQEAWSSLVERMAGRIVVPDH